MVEDPWVWKLHIVRNAYRIGPALLGCEGVKIRIIKIFLGSVGYNLEEIMGNEKKKEVPHVRLPRPTGLRCPCLLPGVHPRLSPWDPAIERCVALPPPPLGSTETSYLQSQVDFEFPATLHEELDCALCAFGNGLLFRAWRATVGRVDVT